MTRNYINLKIVKQLKILYKEKENLYLLVTILKKKMVLYRDGMINLKIGPV